MTFTIIVCSYERSENYWLLGYENRVLIWRAKIGSFRNWCNVYKENQIKFSWSIGHDQNMCQISWKLRTFITSVNCLCINMEQHDTLLHKSVKPSIFHRGRVFIKCKNILNYITLIHILCFSHLSISLTSCFDQNNLEIWRKGTIKMQFPLTWTLWNICLTYWAPSLSVSQTWELFLY